MIKLRNKEESVQSAPSVQPVTNQTNSIPNCILLLGQSKDNDLISLAKSCATVNPTKIEIVGQWIWLQFNRVPEANERAWLKERKFRFNPKRVCWQYAGVPSHRSHATSEQLKRYYGVSEVKEQES